jgi:D-alanine-D-alanine ligase-like ATP-grasp enzyme
MKICVLQPSYAKSELLKEHATYDPPRDLGALVPEWEFTHVFLDKADVYRRLKELKHQPFDVYVNLCEGHLEWDVPSIDVILALESLDLPYTGPTLDLYEPRKETLKLIARYAQVRTPLHVTARGPADVARAARRLRFPLFVKPNEGGDSWGIDKASLCHDAAALEAKATALLAIYDAILIEEFVGGREFSVLVAADPSDRKQPRAFAPVEFRFPEGESFKTYDLKNAQYHPECNLAVEDERLAEELKAAARRVFVNYGGTGYCRMDFRLDADGVPNVLDANFTCSVFYPEGYYGTADYILQRDGFGAASFLRHIVHEGMARKAAKSKPYIVRNDGVSGLGIEATRAIRTGEVIFSGEERSQRIATKRHVETHWSETDKVTFAQYAYPISEEVFILWSEDPHDWAPQNHSCDANTGYDGLDVVALRDIAAGEELTLDYATFCNQSAESFQCRCGAANCRGIVRGTPGNSVELREKERRRFLAEAAE